MKWALIVCMLGGCNLVSRPGLCGSRLMPWERARTTSADVGYAVEECTLESWEQGDVPLTDARCDEEGDCFFDPSVRLTDDEVILDYTDADGVLHQARYLRTD